MYRTLYCTHCNGGHLTSESRNVPAPFPVAELRADDVFKGSRTAFVSQPLPSASQLNRIYFNRIMRSNHMTDHLASLAVLGAAIALCVIRADAGVIPAKSAVSTWIEAQTCCAGCRYENAENCW